MGDNTDIIPEAEEIQENKESQNAVDIRDVVVLDTFVLDFVKDIISRINIDTILIDIEVPWVRQLINRITPFYVSISEIKDKDSLQGLLHFLDNKIISDDIKKLLDMSNTLFDTQIDEIKTINSVHLLEIVTIVSKMTELYNEFLSNKVTDVEKFTHDNFIHVITAILFIILYVIKREELNDDDLKWVQTTIKFIQFTYTEIIPEKTNTSRFLMKCLPCLFPSFKW
jgi:hypothetical protein